MAEFRFPVPPSTNNLYVDRITKGGKRPGPGGRRKHPRYKEWIKVAGLILISQMQEPIASPVNIELCIPRDRRRDLDNYIKPTIDLLVLTGLIDSDRGPHVYSIVTHWTNNPDEQDMWVRVETCPHVLEDWKPKEPKNGRNKTI